MNERAQISGHEWTGSVFGPKICSCGELFDLRKGTDKRAQWRAHVAASVAQAAQPAREPHREIPVWVRVSVDEKIAGLVRYLQTIEGVCRDAPRVVKEPLAKSGLGAVSSAGDVLVDARGT